MPIDPASKDPLRLMIGELDFRRFELGSVNWQLRGGSSMSVSVFIDQDDPSPLPGVHVALLQNYPNGVDLNPLKLFGGQVQSVDKETTKGTERKLTLSVSHYDSMYMSKRRVLNYDTALIGDGTPVIIAQAIDDVLRLAGCRSDSFARQIYAVQFIGASDSTVAQVKLAQNIMLSDAINAICDQWGYDWYVNHGDFDLPTELSDPLITSIATLVLFRKTENIASPVEHIDFTADACIKLTDPNFFNPKYRIELVEPTHYIAADSVETAEAGASFGDITDEQRFPYGADTQSTVFGPLLQTTTNLASVTIDPATGADVPLDLKATPYETNDPFTDYDAAVDIGQKEGDPQFVRLSDAPTTFAAGAGEVVTSEVRQTGYGEAADATAEAIILAQTDAGDGRTTDYAINNLITTDEIGAATATAALAARPTPVDSKAYALRSASFGTRQAGFAPGQSSAITDPAYALNWEGIKVTSIGISNPKDERARQKQQGKILLYQITADPFPIPTPAFAAGRLIERTRVIMPPRVPMVGTAPVATVCEFEMLNVFAGDGTAGETGDTGPAVDAQLNRPAAVAVGAGAFDGFIYIGELGSTTNPDAHIRVVDLSTGNIDLLMQISVDAFFTAMCWGPDDDFLYAAVRDNESAAPTSYSYIVRIDPSDGTYSIVCGSDAAAAGFSGDTGAATAATFDQCEGMTFHSDGDLVFSDTANNRIRKFTVGGNIDTIVGDGSGTFSGDGGAATAAGLGQTRGVVYDSDGVLYISTSLNRIRAVDAGGDISTIAGDGTNVSSGDGGLASAAKLKQPLGLAIDPNNNIYLTELAGKLRMIAFSTGIIDALVNLDDVGNSPFSFPYGVAYADATQDGLYVASISNHRVFSLPCFPTSPAPEICENSNDISINIVPSAEVDVVTSPPPAGYQLLANEDSVADDGGGANFILAGTLDYEIDLSAYSFGAGEVSLLLPFEGLLSVTDPAGTDGIRVVLGLRAEIDGQVFFADFLDVTTAGNPDETTIKNYSFAIDATSFVGTTFTINFSLNATITENVDESIDAIGIVKINTLASGAVLCVAEQV